MVYNFHCVLPKQMRFIKNTIEHREYAVFDLLMNTIYNKFSILIKKELQIEFYVFLFLKVSSSLFYVSKIKINTKIWALFSKENSRISSRNPWKSFDNRADRLRFDDSLPIHIKNRSFFSTKMKHFRLIDHLRTYA